MTAISNGNHRVPILSAIFATLIAIACLASTPTAHAQQHTSAESHPAGKLIWDWPAELTGVFAQGMFENCCINGNSTNQRYYSIKLDHKVSIEDNVQPGEQGVNDDSETAELQLGVRSKDLPQGIIPGTPIAVHCNALWEGMTGHYALTNYCNDAKVTILPYDAKRAQPHTGPAFECAKAHSTAEKLICGDLTLSYLDAELSALYGKAKDKTKNSDAFKQQTASEWKWREANCKDKASLVDWYAHRKEQLTLFLQ
jgi:hypothetical protein